MSFKGRVLIVDDEPDLRKKYRHLLEEKGFEVIESQNALDVAETLMREASSLDLILLDIQIAEVDGRDIFDIIREYNKSLPVIVSSVLPLNEQKLRIPKATDYFNKADTNEDLIKKINNIIGFTVI